MDGPFLLFLAFVTLVMLCIAWTGYYLGKQAAYIEMFASDMKSREVWVKDMNDRRERERNKRDGNNPDGNQG